MADISMLVSGTTHESAFNNTKAYVTENVIDFADALVEKGSALAAADVIQALHIPAGTVVYMAGVQTVEVDDATTLTLNVGLTDADLWVAGYDQGAADAGDYSAWTATTPVAGQMIGETADTVDVTFATLTGTLTEGKIRVWAICFDISGGGSRRPGLVQLGS